MLNVKHNLNLGFDVVLAANVFSSLNWMESIIGDDHCKEII